VGAPVRILVANDDGIYSPGLATLAEVAARFGEVRVVAPDVEQSSMGHASPTRDLCGCVARKWASSKPGE
jgi:5'/3'-nucleotidase SurE